MYMLFFFIYCYYIRKWKQLKYVSIGTCSINSDIHSVLYSAAVKKNEEDFCVLKWNELQDMLSGKPKYIRLCIVCYHTYDIYFLTGKIIFTSL